MEAKKILANGLKARQRNDGEDRALEYRETMRRNRVKGRDIDFVTKNHLHAITRSDTKEAMDNEAYRAAIDRRRARDGDDDFEIREAEKLGLKPIVVLYHSENDGYYWVRKTSRPGKWFAVGINEFCAKLNL